MNKRLLCLLSVLLVGGLLVGCVAPQKETKGKTEEKEKIGYPVREWKWYESKEWGFKIKYPAGADWEAEEFEDETGTGFLVSKWIEKEKTFIFFGVAFVRESDPHLSTYEELMAHPDYELGSESPDIKCLEVSNITLGGFPATKAVFCHSHVLGYSKTILILTKKEGNCYEIEYGSTSKEIKKTEKYFREYLPIANEMINSFRFL
jgi:hypothetical protein